MLKHKRLDDDTSTISGDYSYKNSNLLNIIQPLLIDGNKMIASLPKILQLDINKIQTSIDNINNKRFNEDKLEFKAIRNDIELLQTHLNNNTKDLIYELEKISKNDNEMIVMLQENNFNFKKENDDLKSEIKVLREQLEFKNLEIINLLKNNSIIRNKEIEENERMKKENLEYVKVYNLMKHDLDYVNEYLAEDKEIIDRLRKERNFYKAEYEKLGGKNFITTPKIKLNYVYQENKDLL